ncbi:MAG: MBOAT family O-acyltransferase [Eubacteriales bacterium]|nr:MBOAT family O-acyltransferase [Eubacteriales bacterium]
MLFNSHIFLFLFLPLVLAGWYFLNYIRKFKLAQGYLAGMSLWFYAYFNIRYLWMLLVSCLIGYLLCLWMEKTVSDRGRKGIVAIGCLFHIGMLGYFKYSNFFLENINAVFGTDFSLLTVLMPVGISFYTFQQLAYLVDLYRGDAPLCSPLDYLTFMVYFPQILQGPILRYEEMVPQFREEKRRHFDAERFAKGMQHFTIGLSKKVLLADTLAKAVNLGYGNISMLDCPSAILTAVGYLFELYFDFSGYCDMAVGLGKMIGIEIIENFDSPFKSASVKEFWRRWHITLGRFFTKYVYIPLGGSRKGKFRTVLNTLIIFLLSGLWHGANWTFVFWGLLHGIGVAWDSLDFFHLPKKWMRQAVTFLYVCLAFVFFRAETISQGFLVLKAMVTPKWNGFLFQMGEALDISELYILTKAISMKAPSLLNPVNLIFLLLLFAISIIVLAGKRASAIVEQAVMNRRYAFAFAFLFAWSVLSMAGVSTYIYFSF